jgi:hypothetical protein
MDCSGVHKTL